MSGVVASLHRHPVKGFTPERLARASLRAGEFFPCDRLYAVEDGPSGFDPAAPAYVTKMRFAVLAKTPRVALARTRYDDATTDLTVEADGRPSVRARLGEAEGRSAFAGWLEDFLADDETLTRAGPLRVLHAPGHRFTDHPRGAVSVINLESVRDLARRVGRPLDPLRFRANLYVEGWPAWAEMEHGSGARLRLGGAELRVFKPIVRCAAIDVAPATGLRDAALVTALFAQFGHAFCGLYLDLIEDGEVGEGDRAVFL